MPGPIAPQHRSAHALLVLLPLTGACAPASTAAPASRPTAHRRIVSIAPNATEIIVALGAADRLAAISTFCRPGESSTLPRVGGLFDVNLELLLTLKPDVVILRGQHEAVTRLCQQNGIQLYRDRTESLEDVYSTVRELGDLLGCPERAKRLVGNMQARLAGLARIAAKAGPAPRVLVTLARNPDQIERIISTNRQTFIHDVLQLAGAKNIFADLSMSYPQVSLEAILAAQPDAIIEFMPEPPPDPSLSDKALRQWSALGPMPATRDRKVFVITDPYSLMPGPRLVDVVAELVKRLHPEARVD